MIKAKGVCKNYGESNVLDHLDFCLPKNSVTGILGANGAGKSTIIKILVGILSPTSGKVYLGGFDNFLYPQKAQSLIGYLPESAPLYSDMKVIAYLDYIASLKKVADLSQLAQVIQQCQLEQVVHFQISHLSKGYRQRVALAQALIGNPSILILDEPSSGLDPLQIQEMRQLLKFLGKERTILLSTHILNEIEEICDRVLVLKKGKLIVNSLMKDLKNNQIYLTIPVSHRQLNAALSKISGLQTITEKIKNSFVITGNDLENIQKSIAQVCLKNNWPIWEMYTPKKQLEEIYMELMQQS